MTQSLDSATVTFDLQKYIHQINIEKARKTQPNEKATPNATWLVGCFGMACQPDAAAPRCFSVSGPVASSSATVAELLEVNKTLRYAKETSDIHLVIRGHGRLDEIRFEIYSDASWSTRPDGSSQGGCHIRGD